MTLNRDLWRTSYTVHLPYTRFFHLCRKPIDFTLVKKIEKKAASVKSDRKCSFTLCCYWWKHYFAFVYAQYIVGDSLFLFDQAPCDFVLEISAAQSRNCWRRTEAIYFFLSQLHSGWCEWAKVHCELVNIIGRIKISRIPVCSCFNNIRVCIYGHSFLYSCKTCKSGIDFTRADLRTFTSTITM